MRNLLAGLAHLGLGDLEKKEIYEKQETKKSDKKKEPPKRIKVEEKDLLFDKRFVCPVCDKTFSNKILMTGKARLVGMDQDLRPLHDVVDSQKYDVISCPYCGYAGLKRFFPYVTDGQRKQIKESICDKVELPQYSGETYSYEQCLERYLLALACAIVKHGRNSEKAYICLKSAWLLRGYQEELNNEIGVSDEFKNELADQEEAYLSSAYKGFLEARSTENFPLCGMDETTIDYLLAALGLHFEEYETASRLVTKIITSQTANSRTKDKARMLKDEILQGLKRNKGRETGNV